MNIPTPHIEVKNKDAFAKTVIMPGDPLRAKWISEQYLENPKLINTVRNMFGYTGYYKRKRVTIMGHGMGMASAGIYFSELFNNYDVDNIIRVGSCGSYSASVKLHDIMLVTESYCESDYIKIVTGDNARTISAGKQLIEKVQKSASSLKTPITLTKSHCTDVFYRKNIEDYKSIRDEYNCKVVDMESAALFAASRAYKKEGCCLLTVSDSLVTNEATTSKERQFSFKNMIEIALSTL